MSTDESMLLLFFYNKRISLQRNFTSRMGSRPQSHQLVFCTAWCPGFSTVYWVQRLALQVRTNSMLEACALQVGPLLHVL